MILYVIADAEIFTKVNITSVEIIKKTHATPGYSDISTTHLLLFVQQRGEGEQQNEHMHILNSSLERVLVFFYDVLLLSFPMLFVTFQLTFLHTFLHIFALPDSVSPHQD